MASHKTLPPPIYDPNTGKTFVAIPAPAFIVVRDSSPLSNPTRNNVSGFVYVEQQPTDNKSVSEKVVLSDELKDHINRWRDQDIVRESPPGHTPWEGIARNCSQSSMGVLSQVSLNKPPSNDVLVNINSMRAVASLSSGSMESQKSVKSDSTLLSRTLSSGDTLLNGSLPSICSSVWSSDMSPPHITLVKTRLRSVQLPTPPLATLKLQGSTKKPDKRRFTVCASSKLNRREAHVLERRRTSEEINRVSTSLDVTSSAAKTLSRIDELDHFFSDGIKSMQNTVKQLNTELRKPEAPSMFVSTSTKTIPLLFESPSSAKKVQTYVEHPTPLAARRGKAVPKSITIAGREDLKTSIVDYPEVPTSFRGSPEPTRLLFPNDPVHPKVILGNGMTTAQMIYCLRSQVNGLLPGGQSILAFNGQCKHAEGWLEYEASENISPPFLPKTIGRYKRSNSENSEECGNYHVTPESYPRNKPGASELAPSRSPFSSPPRYIPTKRVKNIPLQKQDICSNRKRSFTVGATEHQCSTLNTPSGKLHRPILSDGTHTSIKKKVRFSDVSSVSIHSPITPSQKPINRPNNMRSVPNKTTAVSPISKRKPPPSITPSDDSKPKVVRDLNHKVLSGSKANSQPVPKKVEVKKSTVSATRITQTKGKAKIVRKEDMSPTTVTHEAKHSSETNVKSITKVQNSELGLLQYSENDMLPKSTYTSDSDENRTRRPSTPENIVSLTEGRDGTTLPQNNVSPDTKKNWSSIKVAGISITKGKRKSITSCGDPDKGNYKNEANRNKENDPGPGEITSLIIREVQKKSGRRSLVFSNVLNRLRS